MLRVAINGYGRIGRCIVRAMFERNEKIQLVAINDLAENSLLAHLTEFDSNHGRFNQAVSIKEDQLIIGESAIKMYTEPDAGKLPWVELNVDIVLECSGRIKSYQDAEKHLSAGAKKVLISAPMAEAEQVVVFGVNHHLINKDNQVISNASCTTNCLAPVARVIYHEWGLESGIMTTVHAYTNDQHLVDQAPGDCYRSRSAAISMIPTSTGAAEAVGYVLPELKGKLQGMAIRVPTANVSVVDLQCILSKTATVKEVNECMRDAAHNQFNGVLSYNEKPLVSVDFNHTSASSTFDANHTMMLGKQLKIMSWYDNEWGFSNRMLDTAMVMHGIGY